MHELELMKVWLKSLFAGLDAEADETTRDSILGYCGEACANFHNSMAAARDISEQCKEVDEILSELNQIEDLWCGYWKSEGEIIYSVCERCGCPLVNAGLVELSPSFCGCSRGWVKAVFDAALGKEVEVELVQAIGRGDPVCKFVVQSKE